MIDNNLLSCTRLGFKPNDSSVNQLIPISHTIFNAHDANTSLEFRNIF